MLGQGGGDGGGDGGAGDGREGDPGGWQGCAGERGDRPGCPLPNQVDPRTGHRRDDGHHATVRDHLPPRLGRLPMGSLPVLPQPAFSGIDPVPTPRIRSHCRVWYRRDRDTGRHDTLRIDGGHTRTVHPRPTGRLRHERDGGDGRCGTPARAERAIEDTKKATITAPHHHPPNPTVATPTSQAVIAPSPDIAPRRHPVAPAPAAANAAKMNRASGSSSHPVTEPSPWRRPFLWTTVTLAPGSAPQGGRCRAMTRGCGPSPVELPGQRG